MRDTLRQRACDVVVYGNGGGFGSDVVIVDTAKALRIPTVTEVMNLNIGKDIIPTVIVAPSRHSMEHPSVRSVVRGHVNKKMNKVKMQQLQQQPKGGRVPISPSGDAAASASDNDNKNDNSNDSKSVLEDEDSTDYDPAIGVVIQPSVDTNHFSRLRFLPFQQSSATSTASAAITGEGKQKQQKQQQEQQQIQLERYTHPSILNHQQQQHQQSRGVVNGDVNEASAQSLVPFVVVGFVARLSPGTPLYIIYFIDYCWKLKGIFNFTPSPN